ncbi:HAD family hydrolase [soil metagenome]
MLITFQTQAILFDMDGVLISSTAADERSWLRWAVLHGMESTFSMQSTHGRRAVDTLAALRPDLDPAVEVAILEDFDAEDLNGILILPGVERLLASLPANRWTIVTSASHRLMVNRLGHAGLPSPRTIITADMVVHGKPHPEPYLAGARALDLDPKDCLVIEDAPAGVAAGKAAGCKVLAVLTSHTAEDLVGADWIIPNLDYVSVVVGADGLEIHLEARSR